MVEVLQIRAAKRMSVIIALVALTVHAASVARKALANRSNPSVVLLDGKKTKWKPLVGSLKQPALLVFTTLWCHVCQREQPKVKRWAKAQHRNIKTLYIVSGSPRSKVLRAVKKRHLAAKGLSVIVDTTGKLGQKYRINATPTFILLDAQGRVSGRYKRLSQVPQPQHGKARAPPPRTAEQAKSVELIEVSDTGRELATSYDVTVVTSPSRRQQTIKDLKQARALTRRLERQLSEWRSDSEITYVNQTASKKKVKISKALRTIIKGSLHVSAVTSGAFDVSWRPLKHLWEKAERDDTLPTAQDVAQVLRIVGFQHVHLSKAGVFFQRAHMELGIAGVGKGWIIDSVFLFLTQKRNHKHVVVNIGGDLRTSGRNKRGKVRRFRILDPYEPRRVAGALTMQNVAVATSGNYFRRRVIAGQAIGHILDPRTGYPPAFDGSVTVITQQTAMADALATALYVMGPKAGIAFARSTRGVDVVYATREGVQGTVRTYAR